MANSGMVLDRVAGRIGTVKADADQALTHFGNGELHQTAEALRRMRDQINYSLNVIRRRGVL